MGEQARFILNIFVAITCIVIPMTDSTVVAAFENGMNQLDGHDISGSFVDVCCDAANRNVGFVHWYNDWTYCSIEDFNLKKILSRLWVLRIGKEMNRGMYYPSGESRLRWWIGFHFLWNLSKFKFFIQKYMTKFQLFFSFLQGMNAFL